ncbi:hypothetical protein I6F65_21530 [Pseudoalteromonas sp. SWXJZ94C]|nr:hypothetical protein [Pseudoalteromonas sp. SWXJZ94C]
MPAMKLIQSVGIGGANKPDDVKAVQTALNSLLSLITPTQKLKVDSRLGSRPENSKTVAAIKEPMGSNLDFIHLLSLC